MATRVRLQVRIDRLVDLDVAADIVRETLRKQRVERFRTKGRADGGEPWPEHRWDASRQVLTGTGKLRDLVEFDVKTRTNGFTIEMFSAPGLELVSNVHQFGTKEGKDIVPRSAKALFIPTSGRGRSSFLNISLGQSAPGANIVQIPKHIEGQPAFGKRRRFRIKGRRGGKSPQVVQLEKRRPITKGKRKGELTGDFTLLSHIPATPEKDNKAIQARPHFRVTKQNSEELVANILAGAT